MHMHRNKCTEIIVNVLSPQFVELLVADIGDSTYRLIIDEARDISTTKLLGVVVRYFSAAQKSIVTTFLALIELDDGTAATIVRVLKNLLTRMGLDKKRLLGIGVDNASVNTGVNNGVSKRCPQGRKGQLRVGNGLMMGVQPDNFCTAHDNLTTCVACTVEDIVEDVTCEVADSSDDGDDIDEGGGEGPPLAAETLHALNILRHAMAADEISDDTGKHFYGFQRSLLSDLTKKKKREDIRDLFCKK
ncbi:hypothetical protein MTO96_044984 [Rhipicephalus appendiculatus]